MRISANDVRSIYVDAVYILDNMGYESRVYDDYSGRGMYGATVDGIVTEAPGVLVGAAIAAAVSNYLSVKEDSSYDVEELLFDIVPTRYDNMGRSAMIYY